MWQLAKHRTISFHSGGTRDLVKSVRKPQEDLEEVQPEEEGGGEAIKENIISLNKHLSKQTLLVFEL